MSWWRWCKISRRCGAKTGDWLKIPQPRDGNVAVQADEFAEMNEWKLGDLRGKASLHGITGR